MSPIPSGLSAQIGIAEETVYGTAVAPNRYYEFVNESLKLDVARIESAGLRAGTRVLRSDRWASGKKSVGGDIEMELANKSFGLWLRHCFGGVATTQPDAAGAPTVFDHTFTPGDLGGRSLTIQAGRPDIGGTVRPFAYEGSKLISWELSCEVDQFARFKVSTIGEDENTALALGVAAYPANLALMTFVQGTLRVAGTEVMVKSARVGGNNGLKDDRYRLGSQLRREALEGVFREYSGSFDADFSDLTAYNRYVNGTEAALELLFEGGVITGTYRFQTRVTCNVRFDGDTPNVGGADEIRLPLKFKCTDTGAGPATAITALYRTTDSAP